MAGRPCTVLLWVRPGQAAPDGYQPTGVVSRWQDTGQIRAELWERHGVAHVALCGHGGNQAEPIHVLEPPARHVAPTPIYREGEKRT